MGHSVYLIVFVLVSVAEFCFTVNFFSVICAPETDKDNVVRMYTLHPVKISAI